MYSFAVYLHTDTGTKRMNTNFSATQKSMILIYQNNLCSSIQSFLSVCKNVFLIGMNGNFVLNKTNPCFHRGRQQNSIEDGE